MITNKYLLKNINLLNISLVVIILIMANYTVLPLLNINLAYILPSQKKAIEEKEVQPSISSPSSLSEYGIIAEENLFHPERKVPPEKKPEETTPLPKPEFIVYGTLITDDIQIAYIEDLKKPVNTSGRGKRQIALKKGDVLSTYTLSVVENDKIVMVRGAEKIVIPVRNTTRSKSVPQPVSPSTPAASGAKAPASQEPLVKKTAPETRAPMSRTDEKVVDFFNSQR